MSIIEVRRMDCKNQIGCVIVTLFSFDYFLMNPSVRNEFVLPRYCLTAIAHPSGDTMGRPSASQTLANQPAALPHSACEVGICNIDTKQPLASASR